MNATRHYVLILICYHFLNENNYFLRVYWHAPFSSKFRTPVHLVWAQEYKIVNSDTAQTWLVNDIFTTWRHSIVHSKSNINIIKSANMAPKINLIKNAIISKKSFPFSPLFIFASCLLSIITSSQNDKNNLNYLNQVVQIYNF